MQLLVFWGLEFKVLYLKISFRLIILYFPINKIDDDNDNDYMILSQTNKYKKETTSHDFSHSALYFGQK